MARLIIIFCGVLSFGIFISFSNIFSYRKAELAKADVYSDWQPVQKIQPTVQPTKIIPTIKFTRSKIETQAIPYVYFRNRKIKRYEYVVGIKLTFFTKTLFGDGTAPRLIVNGVDRTAQIDLMINDMARGELFTKPTPTLVQLFDNFIVIEFLGDKEKINEQIDWLTAQLSNRFEINFVEKR